MRAHNAAPEGHDLRAATSTAWNAAPDRNDKTRLNPSTDSSSGLSATVTSHVTEAKQPQKHRRRPRHQGPKGKRADEAAEPLRLANERLARLASDWVARQRLGLPQGAPWGRPSYPEMLARHNAWRELLRQSDEAKLRREEFAGFLSRLRGDVAMHVAYPMQTRLSGYALMRLCMPAQANSLGLHCGIKPDDPWRATERSRDRLTKHIGPDPALVAWLRQSHREWLAGLKPKQRRLIEHALAHATVSGFARRSPVFRQIEQQIEKRPVRMRFGEVLGLALIRYPSLAAASTGFLSATLRLSAMVKIAGRSTTEMLEAA